MQRFACTCGNALFFENSRCLSCGRTSGWCPCCGMLTALEPTGDDVHLRCGQSGCGAALARCHNFVVQDICNRCLPAEAAEAGARFCDYCQLSGTIPDLSIPGHRARWYRLEVAKRRLLYQLDTIGLPYHPLQPGACPPGVNPGPPLRFAFMTDAVPAEDGAWRDIGCERVYTGHCAGHITINVREADDLQRERMRLNLGEAQRTLIGHFRHEIGHYYWERLVAGQCTSRFIDIFGDHRDPTYAEALHRHYEHGPPADWPTRYISAYASMHPWEDFAETFGFYLDMRSVLDTAWHMHLADPLPTGTADLRAMLDQHGHLVIGLNEMNRTMGLIDLAPDPVPAAAHGKLAFVHDLIQHAATPAPSPL